MVPHLPRHAAPLRLPPAPLRSLRLSLASPIPCLLPAFVGSVAGSEPGGRSRATPGLVVCRSPVPAMGHGERGLSHVPAFPLWLHAPLFDPGGVPNPCLDALRTAAFRPLEPVSVPLPTALRAILLSTTLPIAGLDHAACLLAPPGSAHPLARMHAGVLLTCWLGFRQGGLAPGVLTYWGTTTNCMGFHPIPRSRASLGATTAMLGLARGAQCSPTAEECYNKNVVRCTSNEMKAVADYPNRYIREAIAYALDNGWTLRKSGPRAHTWGLLYCPQADRTGCARAVYSTPRRPEDHAKDIRRAVGRCPH